MPSAETRQLLEHFAIHLPPQGQVFCLPSQAEIPLWLQSHGYTVQEMDAAKDARLLSLPRESFDGIWAGQALANLPIEETQRVVASFFQGLRPKTGVFSAILTYPEKALASMLRQNGFNLLTLGRAKSDDSHLAIIACRI
ncbi:class I SAM-dependent methyltransferase [Bdellovibrionota bacterium FG-1]